MGTHVLFKTPECQLLEILDGFILTSYNPLTDIGIEKFLEDWEKVRTSEQGT